MVVGATTQPQVGVTMDADKMSATLLIPAGLEPAAVTEQICAEAILKAEVDFHDKRVQQVRQAIEQYAKSNDEDVTVTFHGKRPTDGKDGWFEWAPDCDPKASEPEMPDEATEKVDHYNRSAFVTVKQGQLIGTLHPPTIGETGYDVTGKSIAPGEGQPAKIEADDTVMVRPDGGHASTLDGVMTFDGKRIAVSQELNIPGNVDFSTGNIKFAGDVVVRKGIRDKFQVNAEGALEVHGLIEAAHITTGGDFRPQGGMAAKEKGYAQVGGSLQGRYFDNVVAKVRGDVEMHKEIINCQMEVGGGVNVVNGAIIGGVICALRRIETPAVGSGSGDKTIIMLGSAPAVQKALVDSEQEVETRQNDAEQAQERLRQLEAMKATRAASQREALTELMFEISTLQEDAERITEKRRRLEHWFTSTREVELVVSKIIHLGVVIVVDREAHIFDDDVRGPVTIGWDERKQVVVKDAAGRIQPIKTIARVRSVRPGSEEDPLCFKV